jgi:hypothetical protein
MRRPTHTHRCTRCGTAITCDGTMVNNYDGWPEAYCAAITPDDERGFRCEDCEDHTKGDQDEES